MENLQRLEESINSFSNSQILELNIQALKPFALFIQMSKWLIEVTIVK